MAHNHQVEGSNPSGSPGHIMGYIIGADEVGRGCLAGAVYVGAVLVPDDKTPVEGVGDSKALTPKRREAVYETLRADGETVCQVCIRPASLIDQSGIQRALFECFREAIDRCLVQVPDGESVEIRIDGKPIGLDWHPIPTVYIVKGDATDWVIGAASIVAKVERDAYMVRMAGKYPVYGWDANKGYGSKAHRDAIYEHGLTPLHRATFCRNWVRKPEDSIDLFGLFE